MDGVWRDGHHLDREVHGVSCDRHAGPVGSNGLHAHSEALDDGQGQQLARLRVVPASKEVHSEAVRVSAEAAQEKKRNLPGGFGVGSTSEGQCVGVAVQQYPLTLSYGP